ncbi:hypothetical protein ABZ671_01150 [Micromonospora sp. NPDC006766]|uniref:hypothetical protein n=1 Tax=Micromonospora sp. NPDC006766 TaxID=3154778 RepID=UPI0033D83192
MARRNLHDMPGPALLAVKRAIVARWTGSRSLAEATADAGAAAYARAKVRGCGELVADRARRLVEDVGAEMRCEIDELTR